jgi:hypothetical protein
MEWISCRTQTNNSSRTQDLLNDSCMWCNSGKPSQCRMLHTGRTSWQLTQIEVNCSACCSMSNSLAMPAAWGFNMAKHMGRLWQLTMQYSSSLVTIAKRAYRVEATNQGAEGHSRVQVATGNVGSGVNCSRQAQQQHVEHKKQHSRLKLDAVTTVCWNCLQCCVLRGAVIQVVVAVCPGGPVCIDIGQAALVTNAALRASRGGQAEST